jgi:hypothetical protein
MSLQKETNMTVRKLPALLAVLAVAAFLALPALAADDNVHMGKVVSAGKNKLVMTDKDGKTETTHTVAADAVITCDGKACKLEDLKKGITVKVTTKKDDKTVAIAIEGETKEKDK